MVSERLDKVSKMIDERAGDFALIVAIAALVMSFVPFLSVLGFFAAVAALIVWYAKRRNEADLKAPRATRVIAIIALVFSLATTSACVNDQEKSYEESSNLATQQQVADRGVLSFKVVVEGESGLTKSLVVNVVGETSDGKPINTKYDAVPDKVYHLTYDAGTYDLSLDGGAAYNGEVVCMPATVGYSFDGVNDYTIVLQVQKDVAATEAAQKQVEEERRIAAEKEAAEKAAAEEQARKEAAEKAAAEEQAKREAAEAEQRKAEQEAAAAAESQSSPVGATVYIAASGKGKKYHSKQTCSKMKDTIQLTESEAISRGYGRCSKCW